MKAHLLAYASGLAGGTGIIALAFGGRPEWAWLVFLWVVGTIVSVILENS